MKGTVLYDPQDIRRSDRLCSDAHTLTIRDTMRIDGDQPIKRMFVFNCRTLLATSVLLACLAAAAYAGQRGTTLALTYDAQTRGPAPIPPSERSLQTVVAEPWFQVSDEGMILEGPAFERNGNLVFCDVSGQRVLRLTPDKRLSTVVHLDDVAPGGLALHQD